MLSWNNTTGINNDACTNYSLHEINFDFKQPNLSQAIPVGIILGLFTVLTVGGNLLVLLSVGTDRHLRSQRHTVLIANLAIFDLTLGSIVFPFSATLEILDDQWLFGRTFCSIWAAIDVLCCTGSIWSLVSIALDRLIGVTKPLGYNGIMTRSTMMSMIAVTWILSVIISIVPFMGWSTAVEKDPYKCQVQNNLYYVLFSCSVSYYIPLIIILILYSRIYQAATRHVRSMRSGVKRGSTANIDGTTMTLRIHTKRFNKFDVENGETAGSGGSAKFGKNLARQQKATITLTIIIFGFIFMWQGFFLLMPIGVLCPTCAVPSIVWRIFFWLGYCNSLMNPFIYAAASPEFRRAFKRILCCRILSKQKERTLRYEMATHGNSAPKNSDRRFSVCLCLFRPCRACLVSNEGNGDTPDTSDNLPPTPNHIGYPNGNRTPDRTFLGFRLKKTPDPADADLMESFPLASLTLARLKNPTGEADVIYGSLQQLQKISMEESPSRFVTANSINGIYETCMTQSRSCSTQTTPVSMPVSPETVSPYHTIFDRPAPDDAEL